jgi:tetratricopeptide (TPR) repeat protein
MAQLARGEPRRSDDALAAALGAQDAAERSGDPAVLAAALLQIARVHHHRAMLVDDGDVELSLEPSRRALDLAEAARDRRLVSEAAHRIGLVHERRRELAEAEAQQSRAYALAEASAHRIEQAHAARHLGFLAFFLHGDARGAVERLEESLTLFETAGCRILVPIAHQAVGAGYFLGKKDPVRAEPHYRHGLTLAEELGRPLIVAELLCSLGELLAATGRADEARAAYVRSRTEAEKVGHRRQAEVAAARLAVLTPEARRV